MEFVLDKGALFFRKGN